jgi:hypothetical protein
LDGGDTGATANEKGGGTDLLHIGLVSSMLGTRSGLDFELFGFWGDSWGWDPSLYTKFFVSYVPYTQSLKIILLFLVYLHMRPSVVFSTCGVRLMYKIVILEHFRFWTL